MTLQRLRKPNCPICNSITSLVGIISSTKGLGLKGGYEVVYKCSESSPACTEAEIAYNSYVDRHKLSSDKLSGRNWRDAVIRYEKFKVFVRDNCADSQ